MAAGATYEPIATNTLTGTAASVTFSSIPSTYTDLVLITSAKNDSAANSHITIRFNSDSGTNYSDTYMYGTGSGGGSSARDTSATAGAIARHDGTQYAVGITHIQNYANTTTYKTLLSRGGNAGTITQAFATLWRSTSAITSLTVYPNDASNFASGSTFTIYGIASA